MFHRSSGSFKSCSCGHAELMRTRLPGNVALAKDSSLRSSKPRHPSSWTICLLWGCLESPDCACENVRGLGSPSGRPSGSDCHCHLGSDRCPVRTWLIRSTCRLTCYTILCARRSTHGRLILDQELVIKTIAVASSRCTYLAGLKALICAIIGPNHGHGSCHRHSAVANHLARADRFSGKGAFHISCKSCYIKFEMQKSDNNDNYMPFADVYHSL